MLSHPLLWDKTKRAHFLCELNNMIQGLENSSAEVVHLNSFANDLIKDWVKHGWKCRFHSDFMAEVKTRNDGFKYGRFEVKELLRFVRNMLQHFDDYPDYLGSSMDSAYEYVLDGITQLIVIGYDIVKRGNHEGTDRFKRFFCS